MRMKERKLMKKLRRGMLQSRLRSWTAPQWNASPTGSAAGAPHHMQEPCNLLSQQMTGVLSSVCSVNC